MAGTLHAPRVTAAIPPFEPALPREIGYPDWRTRLLQNLSRPPDGRWEPLTYVEESELP